MELCYSESIQEPFTLLCIHHLERSSNKRRTLIIRQKNENRQLLKLKKLLYRKLFLTLHSPYILPCFKDVIENFEMTDSSSVYSGLAEHTLRFHVHGEKINADKLSKCSKVLKKLNNQTVDFMIKILLILSNKQTAQPVTNRLYYDKNLFEKDVKWFQFDQKALNIDDRGINQFGSVSDMDDYMFNMHSSQIFSKLPTDNTAFYIKKHRKESKHSFHTRSTLFGGLTNSTTTSMETSLNLPELPDDPNQCLMTIPEPLFIEPSIDEGFNELSHFSSISSTPEPSIWSNNRINLSVWDEAMVAGKRKVYSWEKDASYDYRLDHSYLSELDRPSFDCLYNVRLSEVEQITGKPIQITMVADEQMYRDSMNALVGVPSQTYTFLPMTCSLKPKTNIRCSGISVESLNGLMTKFASVGTCYRQLNKFSLHHSDKLVTGLSGGMVLRAFINALKEILYSYWSAAFIIESVKDLTLMELWYLFKTFARQLQFLADICLCSEAFKRTSKGAPKPKFPVGAHLLSYLYSLAVKNSSTEQYMLLLFLFKRVSVPYIRFVSDWLFHGVCCDAYNEFFVHIDEQYLCYRDKHFWTQGFQMKQNKESVPLFLGGLTEKIFACGKAINLLKLIDIKHYLFERSTDVPCIGVTFSSAKLDAIEQNSNKYLQHVNESKNRDLQRKEKKKLEEEESWKQKIASAKKTTTDAIAKFEALENEMKMAIQQRKSQSFKELQEQFEEAVKNRKAAKEKKLEEDKHWLNEMKKRNEKEDAITQKAREDLLMFYENLSKQIEKRECRADWIIRRYELTEKRKAFFILEQENNEKELADSIEGKRKDTTEGVMRELLDIVEKNKQKLNPGVGISVLNNTDTVVSKHSTTDESSTGIDIVDSTVTRNRKQTEEDSNKESDKDTSSTTTAASNKQSFVQTLSLAKSILYPDNEATISSVYRDQFSSDLQQVSKRELLGSSALEGSSTKEILYSSNLSSPIKQNNLHPVEGIETKSLLYPEERLIDVTPMKPVSTHSHEGNETRDLIYSMDQSNGLMNTFSRGVLKNEGDVTKTLLYPGEQLIDITPLHVNKLEHEIEGNEAKDLLYPKNNKASDLLFISTRGVAKDIGEDTKNLLYPGENLTEMNNIVRLSEHSDEGKETKSLLYPNENDVPINNTVRFSEHSEDGMGTKCLLYPIEKLSINPMHSSRGTKIEGTETKNILYPDEMSSETTIQHIVTNSEGQAAKSLLYPINNMDSKDQVIRNFERESVMQALLYPDQKDNVVFEKISKGFEPATRIKEMMYPQQQKTEQYLYEVRKLKKEEVWMDSIVEPYTDDYHVMDLEPQAYLFGDTNQSISQQFNQSEPDQDADVIKQLPLETIIKRSLTEPIQAQISLVNKAVVNYFLNDLDIKVHFDAFRKFLLLEDGEFGHSLCSQLFEKVSAGMKPQELCNTMRLNNIIIEALRLSLYAARIEYSSQLTFSLKYMPDIFQASDVAVLDFLELRYRVPWPCNIIVTENSITKYNKVFTFLLRLKKAGWSLHEVWLNLKKAGHDRKSASSPQLRQLQLFRHEMQHFVNNLERYIVNQIIHVSWREFQQDLVNKVDSLDDLHKCHVNYLNKIIFRSLLSKNAAPVYKLINDIFGMICKFEVRLFTSTWQLDGQSGYVTHPLFHKLKSIYDSFKHCTEFLFSVISKLVRRGYQDHLDDLLLQVNFNAFYTTAVVKK